MRILLTTVLLLVGGIGFSQLSNSTLTANADAHTSLGAPTTNYGSADSIPIWVQNTSNYKRGYVKFDMSGIPAGAIIVSAKLSLSIVTEASGIDSTSFVVSASNTAWVEGTINANGNVDANPVLAGVNKSTYIAGTTAKRQFELKEHVQAMVDGRVPNYGWFIRRSTETATTPRARYYSREHSVSTRRPQLIIQYYIPASVSAATITHATSLTSTNGGVTPTVIDGSSTGRTYRWYNSSGTQISTTQNLTGVGYGWYGMKSYGTTEGDTLYYGFIVGAQCEEVTVNIPQNPNYFNDAMVYDLVAGSTNYGQSNYGGYTTLLASSWTNGPWYDARSFMKFQLWVDPGLTINQADLLLSGGTHSNQDRNNVSELLRVTQNWREYGVSHNNRPSTTTTGKVDLPVVANGTTNSTIDLRGFFNTWKSSNATNYGFLMQLTDYTNTYTRRQYHSSDATTASLRPALTMKVAIPNCDLSTRGSVSSVYSNGNGIGDVTLSIQPPYWAIAPYSYKISEYPIPEMKDDYAFFRDTVFNGTLDSASFYLGTTSNTTMIFSGVPQGGYYLAAFDSQGKRIYSGSAIAQDPVSIVTSTGTMSISGSTLTATGTASATVDLYCQGDGDFKYLFTTSSTSGVKIMGLVRNASNFSTYADVSAGFYLNGSTLSYILNGALVGSSTYTPGQSLVMSASGGNVMFYKDGISLGSGALPNILYKTSVQLTSSAVVIGTVGPIGKKPLTLTPSVTIRRCGVAENAFTCVGNYAGATTMSLKLRDLLTGTNYPANPVSGQPGFLPVGSTFTVNSVPSGVYYIDVVVKNGASTIYTGTGVRIIEIRTEISWEPFHPGYTAQSISNTSLVRNAQNAPPLFAKAVTSNRLPTAMTGWLWSQPQYPSIFTLNNAPLPHMQHGFSFKSGVVLDSEVDYNYLATESGVEFYRSGKILTPFFNTGSIASGRMLWFNSGSSTMSYTTFTANDKFRAAFLTSPSSIKLFINNYTNSVGSITRPSGIISVKANSIRQNCSFLENYVTFDCRSDIPYAQLEPKLSGTAYPVFANALYFYYDREYSASTTLRYTITNAAGELLPTPVLIHLSGTNDRVHGDNRYRLDVTTFPAGIYVLEVINEKDEKFYLRFRK